MVASDGSILSLYLHRRRTLSDRQMRDLGADARSLNLTAEYLPPESLDNVRLSNGDDVADVSILESVLYLGNMLLRDSDTNGMAHSLELRVPILDTALLNLMYSLPGSLRLPNGRADKHLLRQAFGDLLSPEQVRSPKRGFALPIGRWMAGPLRDFCEASLKGLDSSLGLKSQGIRRIWESFLKNPDSAMWSRAWELCVLGAYVSSTPSRAEAA
jgi:asparagine synthase (glutamine-hydrolysing)